MRVISFNSAILTTQESKNAERKIKPIALNIPPHAYEISIEGSKFSATETLSIITLPINKIFLCISALTKLT